MVKSSRNRRSSIPPSPFWDFGRTSVSGGTTHETERRQEAEPEPGDPERAGRFAARSGRGGRHEAAHPLRELQDRVHRQLRLSAFLGPASPPPATSQFLLPLKRKTELEAGGAPAARGGHPAGGRR